MTEVRQRLCGLLPEPIGSRAPEGREFAPWIASAPGELVDALLGLEPRVLEETARLLARLGTDAVEVLIRAESQAATKGARKALRRAIHHLRSQGVEVQLTRAERRSPILAESADAGEAFVGPFDAHGHRVVLLLAPARVGIRFYQVLISDEQGVVDAEVREGGRAAARSAVKELRTRSQGALVSAPPAAARELLRRAILLGTVEENDQTRAVATEVETAPTDGKTPGELARGRLGVAPLGEAVAAAELRRRLEKGEVVPWLLRGEGLQALARELDSVEQSPLVLAEVQRRRRQAELIERAGERLFDDAARERLAARLEETAYVLEGKGDEEGARSAAQVAQHVRTEPNPLEVPLLRTLLELSLGPARRGVQEEQKGKLIVSS
jgi:hypothetical protein